MTRTRSRRVVRDAAYDKLLAMMCWWRLSSVTTLLWRTVHSPVARRDRELRGFCPWVSGPVKFLDEIRNCAVKLLDAQAFAKLPVEKCIEVVAIAATKAIRLLSSTTNSHRWNAVIRANESTGRTTQLVVLMSFLCDADGSNSRELAPSMCIWCASLFFNRLMPNTSTGVLLASLSGARRQVAIVFQMMMIAKGSSIPTFRTVSRETWTSCESSWTEAPFLLEKHKMCLAIEVPNIELQESQESQSDMRRHIKMRYTASAHTRTPLQDTSRNSLATRYQDMQLARHLWHSFVVLSLRFHSQPANADWEWGQVRCRTARTAP